MAFPTGWGRKCALVIQNGQVSDADSADFTNFPVLLTKDCLPSEMFDHDGSHPALEGGGDIRFSSDSAGSTRLACEIVKFSLDDADDVAEIWVNVPTVDYNDDTTIYVWYNKSGESQPGEGEAYGKHATWNNDYLHVWHLAENFLDSTENSNDGTNDGSTDIAGVVGRGRHFGGDYDSIDFSVFALNDGFTIEMWHANYNGGRQIGEGADNGFEYWDSGGASALYIYTTSLQYIDESHDSGSGWMYSVITNADGSKDIKWYFDGDYVYTDTLNANINMNPSLTFSMGDPPGSNTPYDGDIDEVRISTIDRSTGWVETTYNSIKDPATFVIEGTPESPGGSEVYIPKVIMII